MEDTTSLFERQLSQYPNAHRRRGNLVAHILTVPLFIAGSVAVAFAWLWPWLLLGVVAMALALAAQGRGHAGESTPPAPFRGPLDFVVRIFVEQWVTFPRFVASGGFARAWRGGV